MILFLYFQTTNFHCFPFLFFIVVSQQKVELEELTKPVGKPTPVSKPTRKPTKVPISKFPSVKPVTPASSVFNWCGVTGRAAGDCHKPCPFGQSSECAAGEFCWAGIIQCGTKVPTKLPSFRPTTKPSATPTIVANNNYCGSDNRAAGDCHKACPFGQSSECAAGESCWAGIVQCPATNGAKQTAAASI
jgi:hypothetical protein